MNKDSDYYRNEYPELQQLSLSLKEDYEVLDYSFSEGTEKGLLNNYTGKVTDISALFTQIFDQYGSRNIGAIILSSDGIYNAGSNPVYAVNEKSFVPVYTVGLGDTTPVRDLKIDAVNHNDVAFSWK